MYEFYLQRPVWFVDFLANPSEQTYFFNGPSLYVFYILLVISLFFKVCIFPTYCKYVIVSGVTYGTWNSLSKALFANKHNYAINKEWREEAVSFRLQKETNCLSNLEQCFKNYGLQFQQFYIMATTTIPLLGIGFSNCFT